MGSVYQSPKGWVMMPKAALNLASEEKDDYEAGGLWRYKKEATAELERIALHSYNVQIWKSEDLPEGRRAEQASNPVESGRTAHERSRRDFQAQV
jgi:hypothetical protein